MRQVIIKNQVLLPQIVQLLNEGMNVTMRVKGCSMLPFINGSHDSVVLSKSNSYKKNDIVLAHINLQQYVIHRIIKIEKEKVTLMGDGNLKQVEVCQLCDLKGKVEKITNSYRSINCDNRIEKTKALIWKFLLPIRYYLLTFYKIYNNRHKHLQFN